MNQIRVIAFVLASMAAAAPFAGAQVAPKGHRAEAGVGRAERGERGGMRRGFLRGMKLSASEKATVRAVHLKYEAEVKPARASLKSAMQEARADRQKGDTAAARAVFQRTRDSRESLRAVMGREESEIRAALTPANRKQFDANVKQAGVSRGKHGMGRGGKRARISNG